jgi:hypothetical protein
VNEQTAIWLGALAGAVVGGALGYLYLSEPGRELREDIEPRMSDLLGELQNAWQAAERARAAVDDAWATVQTPQSRA